MEEFTSKLKDQNDLVLDQTQKVAKVNIDYEKVQESLPNMRLKESQIASELQKNTINLDNQEKKLMNLRMKKRVSYENYTNQRNS